MRIFAKPLLAIIALLVMVSHGVAEDKALTASISKVWTVETARQEAFEGIQDKIDIRQYSPVDPDYVDNKLYQMKLQEAPKDKVLTFFASGGYAVYHPAENKSFFYDDSGKLEETTIETAGNYPIKSYKYSFPSGKLISVSIAVTAENSYIFNGTGTIIGHWVGNKCYNPDGTISQTRSDSPY